MTGAKISVVMATFNSMRTLEPALRALCQQNYARELVEVLVVDGGSTDGTREMALRYGCRVIDNPKVEPVSAKLIGLREATGDYLMHVDSDEVLVSPEALNKRVNAFRDNPEVRMIFSSGYANPPGIPFAARYINEFGDPFSMFYYRLSKDHRFFLKQMRRLYPIQRETEGYVVFSVADQRQPIMENAAAGNCIDLKFFRTRFPDLCDKPWGPVHFFYHMQKFTQAFVITKEDPIWHFSADHWSRFLAKIKWRVRNNVFFHERLGASGFLGRASFDGATQRLKQYLYLPYAFLLLPVAGDALFLMWSRRDRQYWQHVPLTLYTAVMIILMKAQKLVGHKPDLKSYGEQQTISTKESAS